MSESSRFEPLSTPEQRIETLKTEVDELYRARMMWPLFERQRLEKIREIRKRFEFKQDGSWNDARKQQEVQAFFEVLYTNDLVPPDLLEKSGPVWKFKRVEEDLNDYATIEIQSYKGDKYPYHLDSLAAFAADPSGINDAVHLQREAQKRVDVFRAKPLTGMEGASAVRIYTIDHFLYKSRDQGAPTRVLNWEQLAHEGYAVRSSVKKDLPKSVFKDFDPLNKVLGSVPQEIRVEIDRAWTATVGAKRWLTFFQENSLAEDVVYDIAKAYFQYEMLAIREMPIPVNERHPLVGKTFSELGNPYTPLKGIIQKGYSTIPGTTQCLIVREIPQNLAR